MATLKSLYGVIFILAQLTSAHMKLTYPPPRSEDVGIKTGPCGDQTDDFSGSATTLTPGETITIIISEAIHHIGAPYRLSLSSENSDTGYDECILLDHIPQHRYGRIANELHINITVPDVYCDLCAIQALSIMTDKIEQDSCCNYLDDGISGSCFSNYHSCSNVFINGTKPRKELLCKGNDDEYYAKIKWPFKNWKTNRYTQESSDSLWYEISNEPAGDLILGLDYSTNDNIIPFIADPCDFEDDNFDQDGNIDKYVLLIGIDGFGAMYMQNATDFLPNLAGIISNSIYTFRGRNMFPYISTPNWGTLITGMTPIESGMLDAYNAWTPLNTNSTQYMPPITGIGINPPTIFDILKEEYGDKIITAASVQWHWNNYLLQDLNGNTDDSTSPDFYYQIGDDDAMIEAMMYFMKEYKPNFMYICFDDVDNTGHATYWGSDEYYNATKVVDDQIGELIDMLHEMEILDKTLIVVTADHGGYYNVHSSFYSSQAMGYIPVIFNGEKLGFKKGEVFEGNFQINDFVPTILDYFGVDQERYDYMRGRVQTQLYEDYDAQNNANDDGDDDEVEIIIYQVVIGVLGFVIVVLVIMLIMNKKKIKQTQNELQLMPAAQQQNTYH